MKQKTKHTPGPLTAVQIIIDNSPCTWAVQRKNIREQWGKPSVATYIDNKADAKLFAAAPAMYEALRMLIALDPRCHRGVTHCGECGACLGQTALAQAEGK